MAASPINYPPLEQQVRGRRGGGGGNREELGAQLPVLTAGLAGGCCIPQAPLSPSKMHAGGSRASRQGFFYWRKKLNFRWTSNV